MQLICSANIRWSSVILLTGLLVACKDPVEYVLDDVFDRKSEGKYLFQEQAPYRNIDSDNDGWLDVTDNCPAVANPDQANYDKDSLGDDCDVDDDNDRIPDSWEEQYGRNPFAGFDARLDDDGDGLTTFEEYEKGTHPDKQDTDNDTVWDKADNCPLHFNDNQSDLDLDSLGDVCDPDTDGDGVSDVDEIFVGSDPEDASDFILDPYTFRVSRSVAAVEANEFSHSPSISADGTRIAFSSQASNLGPLDENNLLDVYLADVSADSGTLQQMQRVSIAHAHAASIEANGDSITPRISADGTVLAFASKASNLVQDDTNELQDIFRVQLDGSLITRENISARGDEAGTWLSELSDISADGQVLAFNTNEQYLVPNDTRWTYDVFLRDVLNDTLEKTIQGVHNARMTADGSLLVIESPDDRLVSPDENESRDIFLYHVATQGVERITWSPRGEESDDYSYNPDITADGRYVVYQSKATNLVDGDTNGKQDIFVYDRDTGITERVSVSSNAEQGNGDSTLPSISDDGRFVVFQSDATNLVGFDLNGKKDIFLHDRRLALTRRLSVSSSEVQGNDVSEHAVISGDGNRVVFVSRASNLVANDGNNARDIFVRDLGFAQAPGSK